MVHAASRGAGSPTHCKENAQPASLGDCCTPHTLSQTVPYSTLFVRKYCYHPYIQDSGLDISLSGRVLA
jgi:hypothetical protein